MTPVAIAAAGPGVLPAVATPGPVELVIPGAPVAWARAGHRGKQHYTKDAQRDHMRAVRQAWLTHGRPRLPAGPITLAARFSLPRPPSHIGTGRNAGALKPSAPERPTGKPDLSNLLKLVEDALNDLLYNDDAQIVCIAGAHKLYAPPGERPRTVLHAWVAAPLIALT